MSYQGLNHYQGEEDYYAALGVDPVATAAEIKLAFQKLTVRCEVHSPNSKRRELAAQTLARITRAYELLSNPTRRARYDCFLYGNDGPENPRVARFFHEGHKAFRQGNFDQAINRLREAVRLHPHRNIYRIHLALAYAERGWKLYALEELQQAIAVNADDFFAQEALAQIETMEKPILSTVEFTPRFKKQVAGVAAGFLVFVFVFMNGAPQRAVASLSVAQHKLQETVYQTQQSIMAKRGSRTVDSDGYAERPGYGGSPMGRTEIRHEDGYQQRPAGGGYASAGAITTPRAPEAAFSARPAGGEIPRLTADQLPSGNQEYAQMRAVKKTYYPQDNVVVVIYEDGAVMTYKPDDLAGWFMDEQRSLAVMVTRDRELIPAPLTLPMLMPDGSRADLSAPGFPAHLFPEYAAGSVASTSGEPRRGL